MTNIVQPMFYICKTTNKNIVKRNTVNQTIIKTKQSEQLGNKKKLGIGIK